MRTHVEIDPRIALRGFDAVRQLKHDYAWAIDLRVCVFPQEGLTNDPGAEELLVQACEQGADVIGGCPYTDTDPHGADRAHFRPSPAASISISIFIWISTSIRQWMHLDEVCRKTSAHRWGGRVAIGHVTKLRPSSIGIWPRSAAAWRMPGSL